MDTKLIYKTKVNKDNGIWHTDSDEEHIKDRKLCKNLIKYLKSQNAKSIVDCGCGAGYYVNDFIAEGLNVKGYDGNPNTKKFNSHCDILDLSKPYDKEKYDWVLSLEVGEHIPKKCETIFIENLVNFCENGLIISWAIKGQGGSGHFNEQNNEYIKERICSYGFTNDIETEDMLRNDCSLRWFRKSIMVFKKNLN